jgi:hypothetical protein
MTRKAISVVVPLAVAMTGGIYFGLFSCGGYAWHKSLYNFLLVSVNILCFIIFWKKREKAEGRGKTMASLIIFTVLVWATYMTFEAAAATFYPESPTSLSDFWRRFLTSLKYGPC